MKVACPSPILFSVIPDKPGIITWNTTLRNGTPTYFTLYCPKDPTVLDQYTFILCTTIQILIYGNMNGLSKISVNIAIMLFTWPCSVNKWKSKLYKYRK